jgi:hypothetical protein
MSSTGVNMRKRTLMVSTLAAAALLVGGGAAAYASTPAGTPAGDDGAPKGSVEIFTCKDGVVTKGDAVPPAEGAGPVFTQRLTELPPGSTAVPARPFNGSTAGGPVLTELPPGVTPVPAAPSAGAAAQAPQVGSECGPVLETHPAT